MAPLACFVVPPIAIVHCRSFQRLALCIQQEEEQQEEEERAERVAVWMGVQRAGAMQGLDGRVLHRPSRRVARTKSKVGTITIFIGQLPMRPIAYAGHHWIRAIFLNEEERRRRD